MALFEKANIYQSLCAVLLFVELDLSAGQQQRPNIVFILADDLASIYIRHKVAVDYLKSSLIIKNGYIGTIIQNSSLLTW